MCVWKHQENGRGHLLGCSRFSDLIVYTIQARKGNPNPFFGGPDIFGGGGGLPCEGVGAKKFGMSFETQGIVTQNMCFYGHTADHAHVHFLAVAKQLRMNCFDDLFVPTDVN